VLAVQNAVSYEQLGVATSGASLFRSMGGSIGTPIFGAILSNQLASNLADAFHGVPGGTGNLTTQATPESVSQLPPQIHDPYVAAYAHSLQPLFLVGAGIAFLAFCLSWFIKELPLRQTIATSGVGESFAKPSEAESLPELAARTSALAQRENRRIVYERLGERAGVELSPQEMWILFRLDEIGPATVPDLAERVGHDRERLRPWFWQLRDRALIDVDGDEREAAVCTVTGAGHEVLGKLCQAREQSITDLLDGWEPEQHAEIREMVVELTRSLAEEAPHEANEAVPVGA